MDRLADIARFYHILAKLESKLRGERRLAESSGRMEWPHRGMYLFFEPGEVRSTSGAGPRVVRVGTHAVVAGVKAKLWGRLSQHRGTVHTGGGNHRASIMRLLVGVSLMKRAGIQDPDSWGIGHNATKACVKLGITHIELRRREHGLELAVSEHIRAMPFLWVDISDAPGPKSDRKSIEGNSISLLSNYHRVAIDQASSGWLGSYCDREPVRNSGLWNNDHVDEEYDPQFLTLLDGYVERIKG